MAVTLTVDQLLPLSVEFLDRAGNPAAVDGAPTWAVSDAAVATLDVAADGLSATLVTVDNGVVQVTVRADADMGAGATEIFATLDVEVLPGEARVVNLTAAAPVAKP